MNDDQLMRYSRQMLMPAIGIENQQKLQDSTVLMIGAGGLGCSLAQSLSGSGVGHLIVVDDDVIELSNLPRQVLFHETDIGLAKAEVVCQCLSHRLADSRLTAVTRQADLTVLNDLLQQYKVDVLIDAGDNLELTHLLDEVATQNSLPLVHASVSRFEGHVYTRVIDDAFPTLKQLFPMSAEAESCSQSGVLTVAVSLLAAIQATQTLKVLLNPTLGEIAPELLLFDGMSMRLMNVRL